MDKRELLKKFKPKSKKLHVKAWDETVEIRELNAGEFIEINSIIMDGSVKEDLIDGKMNVSIANVEKAKFTRVSKALVNPKLSVEELESLGESAIAGINEINDEIGKFNAPKK